MIEKKIIKVYKSSEIVKGILWIFLIFFGVTFNTSAFINAFVDYLELSETGNYRFLKLDPMEKILLTLTAYIIFFLLYTLVFSKDLM